MMEDGTKLKMFVWEHVLTDYTDGLMVALAHDVDEARTLLREKLDGIGEAYLENEPDVYETPRAVLVWGGG